MNHCGPPSLFQGSKVLAKKELAYVPIIGWMWYFTEMVFCTRKWEQDRKTVSQSLLHLRDYPEKYFVRPTLSSHAPGPEAVLREQPDGPHTRPATRLAGRPHSPTLPRAAL